jgi:putative transposase
MATTKRVDFPGAIHHVYPRGNNKHTIFHDDGDRACFLALLNKLKSETGFLLYAYCLMTNHLHLLIQTAAYPLDKIIGRLLGTYATYHHRKYASVGYLYQGRYPAKLCSRDAYFMRLIRYIHLNPVKAKIVDEPSDWPWSSHRELLTGEGTRLDRSLPLSFFGDDEASARAGYAEFMRQDDPNAEAEFSYAPRTAGLTELSVLAQAVAQESGLALDDLKTKRRQAVEAKLALTRQALAAGHRQIDVARFLGCSSSALTQLLGRET